jgi:hypothetical protein
MKIFAENFRRFSKSIEASYTKGDRLGESIYLNFEDSCAYFSNESFIAKLKFNYEIEDGSDDSIQNMLIDKKMFLVLCQQYDELYLNSEYTFYNGEEEFSIPYSIEQQDYPDFDYNDFISYHLNTNIIRHLRAAYQYMGVYDPQENYFGANLKEDRVVSTDGAQVFEAFTEEKDEDGNDVELPDVKLKGEIVRLILTVAENEVCNLNYNESTDEIYFSFGGDGELDVATTQQDDLRLPDVKDAEFISKYSHDTGFTISKQEILDVLDFFSIFVKTERNERLYFNITDTSTLSIESQAESKGNRQIPLKDCSKDLVDNGIWVPRALVVKAISSINDDFIRFEINPEAPAFNIVGETNENRHVATVRLD